MIHPSNKPRSTPIFFFFFDLFLRGLALYHIVDYVVWEVLWPDSSWRMWQITTHAAVLVEWAVIWGVQNWPRSTHQYLQYTADYLEDTQKCLRERRRDAEHIMIFPVEVCQETDKKLGILLDQWNMLNRQIAGNTLGFVWAWRAARRLYYNAYKFQTDTRHLATDYLGTSLKEWKQKIAQHSQSGVGKV